MERGHGDAIQLEKRMKTNCIVFDVVLEEHNRLLELKDFYYKKYLETIDKKYLKLHLKTKETLNCMKPVVDLIYSIKEGNENGSQ